MTVTFPTDITADVMARRSGTHVSPGDGAPIHRDEEIDHGRSGSS